MHRKGYGGSLLGWLIVLKPISQIRGASSQTTGTRAKTLARFPREETLWRVWAKPNVPASHANPKARKQRRKVRFRPSKKPNITDAGLFSCAA